MRSVGLLVIAMLFLCGSVYAERTVWYVHPDSALNTIQAGLDSCAVNDIVLVGPGTYYENIDWPNTQGIHLVSELGPDVTIVDGNSAGSVITCTTGVDTTTNIHGFTIQSGNAWRGAGIYCRSSSPSITGNAIANNLAGGGWNPAHGGGIACINSSPTIKNNSITDNCAQGGNTASGGGIACDSCLSPMIAYNYIASNEAIAYSARGSAIACGSYSSPTITPAIIGNVITDNSGGYGTVACCVSSGSIIDNIISGNQSHGIVCMWYSSPAIRGNTITENDQCGIECREESSPYIDSCTISGNNSHGISCWGGGDPTVIHCNIHGNSGYGIVNTDGSVTINAEDNWWGHATGPYHPDSNTIGLGDSVSDYVDFDPWLMDSVQGIGVDEQPIVKPVEIHETLTATIFRGPLQLPEGKQCKVYDITGRVVEPGKIRPGIYFIEVDGVVTQKVVKIR